MAVESLVTAVSNALAKSYAIPAGSMIILKSFLKLSFNPVWEESTYKENNRYSLSPVLALKM